MADGPSEKPEQPETDRAADSTAQLQDHPDLEWHLRAHPVLVRARPQPPPPPLPPAAKPAAKPAAPAEGAEAKAAVSAAPKAPAPTAAAVANSDTPKLAPSAAQADKPATPPGGGSPPAAAPPKPAAPAGAGAAAPPKPPAPPKEAPPKPEPLDNDLVKRFKARFGEAIQESWIDRKQAILVVAASKLREIALYARDEEKFNLLADLTAVDWLKREKRFDVVLNLYSFEKNERLRLKAQAGDGEKVPSVASVWGTADWLERECYDMFGIVFEGHPNLRRILLPDEWQGFPLRKDYDILTQDTAWVRENLGIESGQ